MAKKNTKPRSHPPRRRPRKPSAGKAATSRRRRSAGQEHGHHGEPEEEIELDEAESKAVDHVVECDEPARHWKWKSTRW